MRLSANGIIGAYPAQRPAIRRTLLPRYAAPAAEAPPRTPAGRTTYPHGVRCLRKFAAAAIPQPTAGRRGNLDIWRAAGAYVRSRGQRVTNPSVAIIKGCVKFSRPFSDASTEAARSRRVVEPALFAAADRGRPVDDRLTATVKADLDRYAELYGATYGAQVDAAALVPHMLAAFMERDRAFRRKRQSEANSGPGSPTSIEEATSSANATPSKDASASRRASSLPLPHHQLRWGERRPS